MTEPRDPRSESGASEAVDVVAVLLIAFAVIVFFYFIHLVLLSFVFLAMTAFVLTPLIDWLAKTIRAPRLAVALIVFFVLLGLFGFTAYLAIPGLLQGGLYTVSNLQELIEQPLKNLLGSGQIQILGQSVSASDIAAAAVAKVRSLLEGGALTTIVLAAFGGIFGVFLTLTPLAYFLASGRQLVRGVLWIFPPSWRPLASSMRSVRSCCATSPGSPPSSSTPEAPPTSGSASFFTFNTRRSSLR